MSEVDDGEDLVRYYRWLRCYGLNDSHSGNASIRVGERIIITPTGCCADTLEHDQLISCPLTGPPARDASLDTALHLAVYESRPEAGAVLHSHGPHAIAVTMDGENFAPVDFEGQYYFRCIPVLDIPFEHYVDASPAAVAKALADSRVAIVRGHGIYAWGETLDVAYKWTCSAESSARIAWLGSRCDGKTRGELN
jgi:L-fuculose-phosphate aldolase